MKYEPALIARVLIRYFADELTPEDRAILDDWLAESEGNRELLKELRDPRKFMRAWEKRNRIDAEKSWEELKKRAPDLFQMSDDDFGARPPLSALLFVRVKDFFLRIWPSPPGIVWTVLIVFAIVTFIRLIPSSKDRAPVAMTPPQTVTPTQPGQTSIGPSASLLMTGSPVLELNDLSLGSIGESGFQKTGQRQISLKKMSSSSAASSLALSSAVVATPAGVTYSIILPDGTTVWLNAGSKLHIPTDFGSSKRDVSLDGEAFFQVTEKAAPSFTVHINNGKVTCLGTRFVVKAYTDNSRTVVTLEKGAIRVESPNQKLQLTDSLSSVSIDQHGVLKRDDALAASSSWKDGRLEFTHVPADQILEEIAHWYDVKIKYVKSVPKEAEDFYGSITDPVDSTIERLAQIVPFSYRADSAGIYSVSY